MEAGGPPIGIGTTGTVVEQKVQKPVVAQGVDIQMQKQEADTSTSTPVAPKKKKWQPKPGMFYRRRLPNSCVGYETPEGIELFRSAFLAGFANSHFHLVAQFRTQDEPSYCGLSTLAMTLNALAIDPKRVWKGVWRWFDESLLDCCKPLEEVKSTGITLEEFGSLARCNGAFATIYRPCAAETESGTAEGVSSSQLQTPFAASANSAGSKEGTSQAEKTSGTECACCATKPDPAVKPGSLEHFRRMIKNSTSQPAREFNHAIVVSYNRRVLKQTGSGHFSPIGTF